MKITSIKHEPGKAQKETVGLNRGMTGSKVSGVKNTPVKDARPTLASQGIGQHGSLWWGTATDGDDNLEWFYEPGFSLNVRREVHLGMWMPMHPTPRAIKLAVLDAVRNSKQTHLH